MLLPKKKQQSVHVSSWDVQECLFLSMVRNGGRMLIPSDVNKNINII